MSSVAFRTIRLTGSVVNGGSAGSYGTCIRAPVAGALTVVVAAAGAGGVEVACRARFPSALPPHAATSHAVAGTAESPPIRCRNRRRLSRACVREMNARTAHLSFLTPPPIVRASSHCQCTYRACLSGFARPRRHLCRMSLSGIVCPRAGQRPRPSPPCCWPPGPQGRGGAAATERRRGGAMTGRAGDLCGPPARRLNTDDAARGRPQRAASSRVMEPA